ncbi:MAG: hypothetical protein MUO43_05660 [Desulfobacterales bacterium]|nr:hypothetical protein [Desulfobacterales bacterium]
MKLTENGIEIRDLLHDKLHNKYGVFEVSKMMLDRTKVDIINNIANKIDILEQELLNNPAIISK